MGGWLGQNAPVDKAYGLVAYSPVLSLRSTTATLPQTAFTLLVNSTCKRASKRALPRVQRPATAWLLRAVCGCVVENLERALEVCRVENTQHLSVRVRSRGVSIINIDMLLGKLLQHPGQPSGAVLQSDGQNLGHLVLGAQGGEDFLGSLKVRGDEAQDAGPIGLHHRDGMEVDFLLGQRRADLRQPS